MPAGIQAAGDEGRVGAATFRTASRPSAIRRHRYRTRTISFRTGGRACGCSHPKMLGYNQPRDFQVHGVASGSRRALACGDLRLVAASRSAPAVHSLPTWHRRFARSSWFPS